MICDVEIAQLLLLHGGRIGLQDHDGQTALVLAVERDAMEVAQLLVDHGAMENAKDRGANLLEAAFSRVTSPMAQTTSDEEIAYGKSVVRRLSFLLENGVSASEKEHGESLLGHAIRSRHTEVVTLLLDHGADPNEECFSYAASLSRSISLREFDIARLVIERGASVLESHLTSAIERKADTLFLRMLIAMCEDSQSPSFGHAALATAIVKDRIDVIQTLHECDVDFNSSSVSPNDHAIVIASELGRGGILDYIISHGARLDLVIEKQTVGNWALHRAAQRGNAAILRLLLLYGVEVNDSILTWYHCEPGHTMVCRAAQQGHLESVQILLQNGAGLEARCDEGHTALMEAAREKEEAVVRYLLNAGANVNVQCKSGHTPFCQKFYWSFEGRSGNVQQLLQSVGAPPKRCKACETAMPW